MTGYLTANVQIDKNGYFDSGNNEPDAYDDAIEEIIEKYGSKEYRRLRADQRHVELCRDKDGFFRLERKLKGPSLAQAVREDPERFGVYRVGPGLYRLIPKMERNQRGFIVLTKVVPQKGMTPPMHRDPDGFYRLHRVTTKMDAKKKK